MYDSYLVDKHLTEQIEVEIDNIFIDEDLQVEAPDHNCPLYLEGYENRVHLNRILIVSQ